MISQLELIEDTLRPMSREVSNVKEQSNLSAARTSAMFLTAFLGQFFITQYGTYVMFSWDIMEPITCGMTLMDAIFSYSFWLWSGKPWDLDGLKKNAFDRKMKRLLKKHNMDYFHYT